MELSKEQRPHWVKETICSCILQLGSQYRLHWPSNMSNNSCCAQDDELTHTYPGLSSCFQANIPGSHLQTYLHLWQTKHYRCLYDQRTLFSPPTSDKAFTGRNSVRYWPWGLFFFPSWNLRDWASLLFPTGWISWEPHLGFPKTHVAHRGLTSAQQPASQDALVTHTIYRVSHRT